MFFQPINMYLQEVQKAKRLQCDMYLQEVQKAFISLTKVGDALSAFNLLDSSVDQVIFMSR